MKKFGIPFRMDTSIILVCEIDAVLEIFLGTPNASTVGTDSDVLSVNMFKAYLLILCRLKLFIWIIYRMATLNVPNVDDNFDFIFESVIETLCSTHIAVSIDTDAQQKLEFKSYLVTALVPFDPLSTNLGYTQKDPDFTVRTTDEICHKILSNMKDKIYFIQSLDRKDDIHLVRLLNWFANQKIKRIRHKLLTYHHMTDLYSYNIYDC